MKRTAMKRTAMKRTVMKRTAMKRKKTRNCKHANAAAFRVAEVLCSVSSCISLGLDRTRSGVFLEIKL